MSHADRGRQGRRAVRRGTMCRWAAQGQGPCFSFREAERVRLRAGTGWPAHGAGTGDCAALRRGNEPPFPFRLRRKENGRSRSKEKALRRINLTRMCQVDRKYGGRRSRCDTDLQTCTGCAPHRQNRDSLPPHVGTAGLLSRRSKKGWSCWPRAFRFAARYMGSQRCICGKRTPSGVRFLGKGGQAPLFI